jgi:beta-lactamase class A
MRSSLFRRLSLQDLRAPSACPRTRPARRNWPSPVLFAFATLLFLPAYPLHGWGPNGYSVLELAAQRTDPGIERLEAELRRIEPLSGGTLGIHAIHLESGRTVSLNAEASFPMASTYKVPIAYQLLRRVDRGEIRLDSLVAVESHHYRPGSGTLSDLLIQPGVALSVRNLTELMLLISDNTATDMVLEIAGGPEEVTTAMEEAGFGTIRVARPTLVLIADWLGLQGVEEGPHFSLEAFRDQVEAVPVAAREAATAAFDDDRRDTTTPREMALLLQAIWTDHGLSPESAHLLRDIMDRCRTGEGRLRGLLPEYVNTANKTGTIGGSLNDVGVIELPNDGGHLVVAAFIKGSELPNARRESAMAHAARALYDYFAMNP